MAKIHPAYEANQYKYWTRHDAWRFRDVVKYGEPNFGRSTEEKLRRAQAEEEAFQREVAELRATLAELKAEIEAGRQRQWREAKRLSDLRWQRFVQKVKAGFNPDQPRVPAGNPDGGQWTSDGNSSERVSSEGNSEGYRSSATDLSGQRRSKADGHHHVPRGVYEKLPLPPETRKVFEEGKTGPLYDTRSNKYDTPHRQYNEAVANLFEEFVARNGIRIERMTPDQAQSFLSEVLGSQDPRIRNYNTLIQMREIMQRVFRRTGRPE
jgi:hypothetical protein